MRTVNEEELAKTFVRRFGESACREANARAEALAVAGDLGGEMMWRSVARLAAVKASRRRFGPSRAGRA